MPSSFDLLKVQKHYDPWFESTQGDVVVEDLGPQCAALSSVSGATVLADGMVLSLLFCIS